MKPLIPNLQFLIPTPQSLIHQSRLNPVLGGGVGRLQVALVGVGLLDVPILKVELSEEAELVGEGDHHVRS